MEPKRTPRIELLTAIAASALIGSCTGEPSGFPGVQGWTQAGEVRVYNAENLWEYINGAAVLFVEYGVRTCTTADLSAAGVSVTVDLYEMASPLGAVGVFKRESAGGGMNVTGATVAALSPPYQALMVRGNTYAKVNAYEGELTESEGRQLLEGLAASLPGEALMPQEFSLLPEEGRVAGSEGYQPGSLLSLTELTDCLYADYMGSEGETWEGFVVLPSAASNVWEALADRWESFEHDGLTVLFREVPYSGLVGFTRTDSGMFGVSGAADETQLRERLGAFASRR
ncbi:DUF6599 family protein [Gemmatimonadota bacterium]